jgi:hypothetical protein
MVAKSRLAIVENPKSDINPREEEGRGSWFHVGF